MVTACIEKFLDEEKVDDPFVNDTFWAKGAEALRLRRANWITIYRKKTGKRRRIKGKNREWVTEVSAVDRIVGYTILHPKGLSGQSFVSNIHFEDKIACLAYCLHFKRLTVQAENIIKSFVCYDLWRKIA